MVCFASIRLSTDADTKALSGKFHVAGQYRLALHIYQESKSLFGQTGDPWGLALGEEAQIYQLMGLVDRGKQLYEESLALYGGIGEARFRAFIIGNLARIAYLQGDYDQAERGHRQSLQMRRELGDRLGVAFSLIDLADLARVRQAYEEAEGLYLRGLHEGKKIGGKDAVKLALLGLCRLANARGEYEQSEAWQWEGLALCQKSNLLDWQFRIESGWSHLGLEAHDLAEASFLMALKTTYEEQISSGALAALAGLAALKSKRGDPVKAIEWLTTCSAHPAADVEEKTRCRDLLVRASAGISPQMMAAAEERVRAQDLWQIVAGIMGNSA